MKVRVYADEWYPAYDFERDPDRGYEITLTPKQKAFVEKAIADYSKAQHLIHQKVDAAERLSCPE
jgi:hypothetical protein